MQSNFFFHLLNTVIRWMTDTFEFLDGIHPFNDVPLSLFWILLGAITSLQIFEVFRIVMGSKTDDSDVVSLDTSDLMDEFEDDDLDFDDL